MNVGYDTFLAYSFLLSGVITPALLIDTLQVMAMRNLGNMRQEITYSCVFTKKHLFSMCDAGKTVQNAVFFFFCCSSVSIITLSLSHHFQEPRKKSVGASHSYFRTCNLVTFFIIVLSSKTQRKLLQPYSRIFTCFVLSPTLQKVVLTLSKNMSVYTKTYEGNTHRVSACDTYINVLTLTEVFLTLNEVFP